MWQDHQNSKFIVSYLYCLEINPSSLVGPWPEGFRMPQAMAGRIHFHGNPSLRINPSKIWAKTWNPLVPDLTLKGNLQGSQGIKLKVWGKAKQLKQNSWLPKCSGW